jgi:hypothetical protein
MAILAIVSHQGGVDGAAAVDDQHSSLAALAKDRLDEGVVFEATDGGDGSAETSGGPVLAHLEVA